MIAFLSGEKLGQIRKLQNLDNKHWNQCDFDFLVDLYKEGPTRLEKITERIDIMKKQNEDRVKRQE